MATSKIKGPSINKTLISSVAVNGDGTYPINSTQNYSLIFIELEGNDANRNGALIPNNRYVSADLNAFGTSTIYVKLYARINDYNTLVVQNYASATWSIGYVNVYGIN